MPIWTEEKSTFKKIHMERYKNKNPLMVHFQSVLDVTPKEMESFKENFVPNLMAISPK